MSPRPPPTILVVDGDPGGAARVGGELRRRYAGDYRIVTASDPAGVGDLLDAAAADGGEVALALAGGPAGAVDGAAVLAQIAARFPHCRRGLLVDFGAWGDASASAAILAAMARGAVDYYVLRPSRSPDEFFHRTVTEFLHEWSRARPLGPREVTLVGAPGLRRTAALRRVLAANGIPHRCLSPDEPDGARLLADADVGAGAPAIAFHDGRVLVDPADREVAAAFGFRTELPEGRPDVVIVGAGPAGLAAAVYASADGLRTLVIERESIGGQAGSSSLIRNYLGFARGISGAELAIRAYQQAWVFGASVVLMRSVAGLERDGGDVVVTLSDGSRVRTSAVVLAMGVAYRRLQVPAIDELVGAGVHYGASASDAPAFAGRKVVVLGGGNSAGQAALHLARHAHQVTVVVRGEGLDRSMSRYLIAQLEAAPRITVLTGTEVVGGGGDGRLRELLLRTGGVVRSVAADGLFIFIGAQPHTGWLPPEVACDERGFILTGPDAPGGAASAFATTMPGVYAAGDVRHGSMKRVGSAVGEGAGVIREVFEQVRGATDAAAIGPPPPAGAAAQGTPTSTRAGID